MPPVLGKGPQGPSQPHHAPPIDGQRRLAGPPSAASADLDGDKRALGVDCNDVDLTAVW